MRVRSETVHWYRIYFRARGGEIKVLLVYFLWGQIFKVDDYFPVFQRFLIWSIFTVCIQIYNRKFTFNELSMTG